MKFAIRIITVGLAIILFTTGIGNRYGDRDRDRVKGVREGVPYPDIPFPLSLFGAEALAPASAVDGASSLSKISSLRLSEWSTLTYRSSRGISFRESVGERLRSLRALQVSNPYEEVDYVTRDLSSENHIFDGDLFKSIRRLAEERSPQPVKVLLLGAGAGVGAYHLMQEIDQGIELYAINREIIRVPAKSFLEKCLPLHEFGESLKRHIKMQILDFYELFQRSVIIHNLEQGLPMYQNQTFDAAVLTYQVMRYISRKDHTLREIKRVLRHGGQGFIADLHTTFKIEGHSFRRFIDALNKTGYDREYIYMESSRELDGLRIHNLNPQTDFPRLHHVKTEREDFTGLPRSYTRMYRLPEWMESAFRRKAGRPPRGKPFGSSLESIRFGA